MVAESRFFCDSLGPFCFGSDLTHAPKGAGAELRVCSLFISLFIAV